MPRDPRTGHKGLHSLAGLLRQSVFGHLAGYEDVIVPVVRQVVAGRDVDANAASASQVGGFETEVLATTDNRTALADLSGQWIDRVHARVPPKWIPPDIDSSVRPLGVSVDPLPLDIAWDLFSTYYHVLRILTVIPAVCAIIDLFPTAPDNPETEIKHDGETRTV